MSERKVLNKYYPPDFDPSKIPRMKLSKNRQYTVRLMAPFNMRCKTCGEYIYKGKKFNARKEDVEHETYLGIRIYRFYIKCTRCLQEISFKTDPKNTDYEIEAGATRNFMALKMAEEQARREEEELREEEANNPMKLLENRTQQSRNEIEMLESLEELRDLNRRQETVDYETMLQQYNTKETERERLERQEREDEEYIKSINFKNKNTDLTKKKIVAEEIIEEVKDDDAIPSKVQKTSELTITFKKPAGSSTSTSSKAGLSNIVKRKQPLVVLKPKSSNNPENQAQIEKTSQTSTQPDSSSSATSQREENSTAKSATGGSGLSLLSAYSDSSEDSN
ncbi:splicing factor YJU2 [Musca vetustissima]|uniref:splicing factor YJU2 n=1 Tax=Musca vetustissima TaxID=27455 RepID=UPI002AB64596|nr:splicing factor YJU2 [Musca vetustissima]